MTPDRDSAVVRLATRIGRTLTPLAERLASSGLVSSTYYEDADVDLDTLSAWSGAAEVVGSSSSSSSSSPQGAATSSLQATAARVWDTMVRANDAFPISIPDSGDGRWDGGGGGISRPGDDADTTLALLLPLLILLSTLLFLLLLFLLFLIIVRRRRGIGFLGGRGGIRLGADDRPIDLGRDDEVWAGGEGGLLGMESRWLEQVEETTALGYQRARLWQLHHPPNSLPTDITLSQFLSIQEKGVSAWAFEPDYDSNPSLPVFVQSRTEITFLPDGAGMAPEEGGGVCVQSNLPLPKLNEVYYWECKVYDKPESTQIAIGLATKPYPSFRLPGWNKLSIGYFSADGFKTHNYPFTATSYGPPLQEGDVLGIGYRPRTGTVFFTRNGKKLEDAFVGLHRYNVFPTVGADGPAQIHVNLGQAGFVFIEANVKKWGLAPMAGTLAPPPAYGHQNGSILLARASEGNVCSERSERQRQTHSGRRRSGDVEVEAEEETSEDNDEDLEGDDINRIPATFGEARDSPPLSRPPPKRPHSRSGVDVGRSGLTLVGSSQNQQGHRPRISSPLIRPLTGSEGVNEVESEEEEDEEEEEEEFPHNPPTPRPLDISLVDLNNRRSRTRTTSSNVTVRASRHSNPPSSPTPPPRESSSSTNSHYSHRPVPYETAVQTSSSQRSRRGPSPPDAAGVAEAMLAEQFPGMSVAGEGEDENSGHGTSTSLITHRSHHRRTSSDMSSQSRRSQSGNGIDEQHVDESSGGGGVWRNWLGGSNGSGTGTSSSTGRRR